MNLHKYLSRNLVLKLLLFLIGILKKVILTASKGILKEAKKHSADTDQLLRDVELALNKDTGARRLLGSSIIVETVISSSSLTSSDLRNSRSTKLSIIALVTGSDNRGNLTVTAQSNDGPINIEDMRLSVGSQMVRIENSKKTVINVKAL